MIRASALDKGMFKEIFDELIFSKKTHNEKFWFIWKILDVLIDKVFKVLHKLN